MSGGRPHLIQDVRFREAAELGKPSSEAQLRCSCGVVVTSGTWDAHRGLSTVQERQALAHAAWRARHAGVAS